MTERKPPGVSHESWVERQIRLAEERGDFSNLAGHGKPIPGLDRQRSGFEWAADAARRGDIDVSALLPPSLALPKELETLRERLVREPTETAARKHVEDLNKRIREAHARPQVGPPLRAWPVDVEETVAQWREDRAARLEDSRRRAREALAEAGLAVPGVPGVPGDATAEAARGRRRWWRRPG